LTVVPGSSVLVVRTATPPRLMFSVKAAAMVLPTRYETEIPTTTRGLERRLQWSGKRCGVSAGTMCCTAVYSFT
jgi:hypothetical protein